MAPTHLLRCLAGLLRTTIPCQRHRHKAKFIHGRESFGAGHQRVSQGDQVIEIERAGELRPHEGGRDDRQHEQGIRSEIPVHEIAMSPESVRHLVPDDASAIRLMMSLRNRHVEGGSVQLERQRKPEQLRRCLMAERGIRAHPFPVGATLPGDSLWHGM